MLNEVQKGVYRMLHLVCSFCLHVNDYNMLYVNYSLNMNTYKS